MEINEQQFIKGFNDGYILANHEPTLLHTILNKISPANSYVCGLISGQKEYDLVQVKDHETELTLIRQKHRDNRDRG